MNSRSPLRLALCLTVGGAVASLAACQADPKPPVDPGVCYKVQEHDKAPPEFFVVAKDVTSVEMCAANLEQVRSRFIGLGSAQSEVVGAYNGQFLFLDAGGASVSSTLHGGRYVALRRMGDGSLVLPQHQDSSQAAAPEKK